MRLKVLASLAVAAALTCALGGCAAGGEATSEGESSDQQAQDAADATLEQSDFDQAGESLAGATSDGGLVSLSDAQREPDTGIVRMTFVAAGTDVQGICAQADQLIARYSQAVYQAAAERAQQDGNQDAADYFQQQADVDEQSDGLGQVFDQSSLIAVIDDGYGTLNIAGSHDAGAQAGMNWQ